MPERAVYFADQARAIKERETIKSRLRHLAIEPKPMIGRHADAKPPTEESKSPRWRYLALHIGDATPWR